MGVTRKCGHDWTELHLSGVSGPGGMLQHRLEINEDVEQPLFLKEVSQLRSFMNIPKLGFLYLLPPWENLCSLRSHRLPCKQAEREAAYPGPNGEGERTIYTGQ